MAKQVEQAPGFIAVLTGPELRFELANAAYRRMTGNRNLVGLRVREAFPEIEGQGFFELLDQVYRTGTPYVGRRLPIALRTGGTEPFTTRWLDFVYQPIIEADGSISGVFVEGQDVTDHVRAEERLAMLNEELRHRVKNMIAVIGSMATQTLRHSASPDALNTFQSRLVAFATAHEALTDSNDAPSSVEDVIHIALDPHLPDPDRCSLSGPAGLLGAKQAVALALTIHELATNASKYGAISNEDGRVDVSWVDKDGTFVLQWRESGGPSVVAPRKLGFGSRLIEIVAAADLGGKVAWEYDPEGLKFTLTAPVDRLNP
jgi:two-component sensor histidine kinase